jgi:deoxyribodipyrimidine photo-lyase
MGGAPAAANALDAFVSQRLERYEESRNRPEEQVTSGLSPYLHFGHISPHQIFARVAENYGWTPSRLSSKPNGRSRGWWGLPPAAEAFLDQLVTWRELGYNMCWQREDHDRYESLPDWARATLDKHAADPRPYVYTAAELESAATHDPLWNAAQRQLVRTGGIHNYLRMLWGKKILEWSPSAEQALEVMIHLNNKYALDGRNPNSYTGIFWVLGRYDRPWAPERPVLGRIRYMSSDNTARKMRVSRYLEVFGR